MLKHGNVIGAVTKNIGILQSQAVVLQYHINGRGLGKSFRNTLIKALAPVNHRNIQIQIPKQSCAVTLLIRQKAKLVDLATYCFRLQPFNGIPEVFSQLLPKGHTSKLAAVIADPRAFQENIRIGVHRKPGNPLYLFYRHQPV